MFSFNNYIMVHIHLLNIDDIKRVLEEAKFNMTATSHRHHGIWNHQQTRLFIGQLVVQANNKENIKALYPLWLVDYPHKGPVMRKAFLIYDIIENKSQKDVEIQTSLDFLPIQPSKNSSPLIHITAPGMRHTFWSEHFILKCRWFNFKFKWFVFLSLYSI